jgi:threonyl-tRNA synthetase
VALVLSMIEHAYAVLGLSGHHYRLSLRGDGARYCAKHMADPELWDKAEAALAAALDDLGVPYEPVPGEAAFYGPKIDVQVPGCGGREESLSSVQLDYHLPARFELSYAAADGARQPVMLHRSVLGSMERCLSFLLEQHNGNLPVWLAPVQVVLLPVNPSDPAQARAAGEVANAARSAGLRVEVSAGDEQLGARMRRARLARVPYRLVIGDREAPAGLVAVNLRDGRRLPPLPAPAFVAGAAAVANARGLDPWP